MSLVVEEDDDRKNQDSLLLLLLELSTSEEGAIFGEECGRCEHEAGVRYVAQLSRLGRMEDSAPEWARCCGAIRKERR